MPNLLVFVPCERVIIDENGSASLIIILQDIEVQLLPGQLDIPKNAITPKEWSIFAVWRLEPEETGKEFVQIVQLLLPDNSEFKKAELKFLPKPDKFLHQNRINIVGFPIGQIGPLKLKMWLEKNGKKIGDDHTYILNVSHHPPQ